MSSILSEPAFHPDSQSQNSEGLIIHAQYAWAHFELRGCEKELKHCSNTLSSSHGVVACHGLPGAGDGNQAATSAQKAILDSPSHFAGQKHLKGKCAT